MSLSCSAGLKPFFLSGITAVQPFFSSLSRMCSSSSFQAGDRVTFQGHYGNILSIGVRSVKILTIDKSVVTIPNNRFLSDSVSSSSVNDLGMMIAVDVHVSPEANLYKIKEIIRKETEKNQ